MAPKLHGTNPRARAASRQGQAAYERAERSQARRDPITGLWTKLRGAIVDELCDRGLHDAENNLLHAVDDAVKRLRDDLGMPS